MRYLLILLPLLALSESFVLECKSSTVVTKPKTMVTGNIVWNDKTPYIGLVKIQSDGNCTKWTSYAVPDSNGTFSIEVKKPSPCNFYLYATDGRTLSKFPHLFAYNESDNHVWMETNGTWAKIKDDLLKVKAD